MRKRDDSKIDQIFTATLSLIEEYGMSGMNMSLIAKRAGLATGTIYIYFPSKEELFHQLYAKTKKDVAIHLLGTLPVDGEYKDKIHNIWFQYLSYRIHYHSTVLFQEQYYYSQLISPDNKDLSEQIMLPIRQMIDQGRDLHILKDTSTEIILMSLI